MSAVEFKSIFVGISIEDYDFKDPDAFKDLIVADFKRVGETETGSTVRPKNREDKDAPLIEVGTGDDSLSVWVGPRLVFVSAHQRQVGEMNDLYAKLLSLLDTSTYDDLTVKRIRVANRAAFPLAHTLVESGSVPGRLSPFFAGVTDTDATSIQYSVTKDEHHSITFKYETTLKPDEGEQAEMEFEALHVIEATAIPDKKVRSVVQVLRNIDIAAEVDDGIGRARKGLA